MARILLSAMYCEPNRGSEEGVGWHFAVELTALGHDVTVLVHERYRAKIEAYLEAHEGDRLPRFAYLGYPAWARALDDRYGIPDQITHEIWQYEAYRHVKTHMNPAGFDLIWHVTIGVVRQASLLYGFGVPFVFGPVAGGETSPWAMRRNFTLKDHLTELLRDSMNLMMPLDVILSRMLSKSVCILPRSPETRALIPQPHRRRAHCNIGIGIDRIDETAQSAPARRFEAGQPLKILYTGRFLYWKQPIMAIDAFAAFLNRGGAGELTLFGSGKLEDRCRARIGALGLDDKIRMVQFLPQQDFFDVLRASDVVVFPSLHDGGGMVPLEAMAFGVPVIAFDLGGPGQIVTNSSGRLIRTAGLDSAGAAREIAVHLKSLQDDPALRAALRQGALERAQDFLWSNVVRDAARHVDDELARAGASARLFGSLPAA